MGAAVGVLVAVFQWEWVAGVVGVTRQGPVEAFLPVFLLPPSFRLSMDYEVFLLTRIHEEYLRTGDNSGSVRLGLSTAILLDAVIVRSALGPALMQMSGKANWWFPGWLDRMLPHLHVESEDADAELVEATEGEAVGVSQPRQNPGLRVFALFFVSTRRYPVPDRQVPLHSPWSSDEWASSPWLVALPGWGGCSGGQRRQSQSRGGGVTWRNPT